MKKLLLLLSFIVSMLVGFSACNNEPSSSNTLIGNWYVYELPSKGSSNYSGKAYYFVNSNTVKYYNYISGAPRWDDFSEKLTGPMDGYYVQSGGAETYTYEVKDNKIYIPMQGNILTIDGDILYWEGSSSGFTKM